MRQTTVSRRRLLVGASVGSAALAVSATVGDPAAVRAQTGDAISAEFVGELAQATDLPLAPQRLQPLAVQLRDSMAQLRALRPAGYDDLVPASVFAVPLGE